MCLRCGGDKCVCDREKQQTTKLTTKSLINIHENSKKNGFEY